MIDHRARGRVTEESFRSFMTRWDPRVHSSQRHVPVVHTERNTTLLSDDPKYNSCAMPLCEVKKQETPGGRFTGQTQYAALTQVDMAWQVADRGYEIECEMCACIYAIAKGNGFAPLFTPHDVRAMFELIGEP